MKKNKVCRMCDGTVFRKVINFGKNALVNSLIEKENLDKTESVFPLVVNQCQNCHLVQITNIVDAHEIYKNVDYLYFSGDMPGLSDYFKEYASDLITRFLEPWDFVVEIGSNDGTMLKHFEEMKVLGVDPASNVVVRALKDKIPTVAEFFTDRLAKSIVREYGKAKLVFGNNCIAHLNDLRGLMEGVRTLLADNGVFVVECNYWGGMVKNKNYALVYHDHFSYFSLKNWADIADRYGMQVFDAVVTPAQGGSLRVFMSKGAVTMTKRCLDLVKEEVFSKLNTKEVAIQYGKDCIAEAQKLFETISNIKTEG